MSDANSLEEVRSLEQKHNHDYDSTGEPVKACYAITCLAGSDGNF